MLCKWYNFSILPKGMQGKNPKKFKWPKVKRGENYKWEVDSDDESDDDSDSSDSDTDSASESVSSDDESSDDEWY